MRQFQTTVLDFKHAYTASFASAPFEAAWASEAIFFARVEEISGEAATLTLRAQISVDGVHWVDEGSACGPLTTPGDTFLRVRHFGGFLRLCGDMAGRDARLQLTTNLVLKE